MLNIIWSIAILIVSASVIMFLINTYRYLRVKSLHKKYLQHWQEFAKDKASWDIVRHQSEIKELLSKANVGDPALPRAEAMGLGQVLNHTLNVIDNMVINDKEVVGHMMHLFHAAEGTFSYRMRQSINPIFWIETIVFLPSNLLGFFGVSPTSSFSRVANLLMWIVGATGFVFSLPDFYEFRDATSSFLADLFSLQKND